MDHTKSNELSAKGWLSASATCEHEARTQSACLFVPPHHFAFRVIRALSRSKAERQPEGGLQCPWCD
eukprot:3250439-Pyramimonas_sp.AAC.1